MMKKVCKNCYHSRLESWNSDIEPTTLRCLGDESDEYMNVVDSNDYCKEFRPKASKWKGLIWNIIRLLKLV